MSPEGLTVTPCTLQSEPRTVASAVTRSETLAFMKAASLVWQCREATIWTEEVGPLDV